MSSLDNDTMRSCSEANWQPTIDQIKFECAWSLYRPEPGDLVIDIACGSGAFSRRLMEAGARVVGIDCNHHLVSLARTKDDSGIYQQMELPELDFPDDYFDAAIVAFAYQETADADRLIKEARRVVKPAGSILAGMIVSDNEYDVNAEQQTDDQNCQMCEITAEELPDILSTFSKDIKHALHCSSRRPDQEAENTLKYKTSNIFFVHWIKSRADR